MLKKKQINGVHKTPISKDIKTANCVQFKITVKKA